MRTFDVDILMVPGTPTLGPDHWQSRWLTRLKTARRVDLAASEQMQFSRWTARLMAAVAAAQQPVVFVAHGAAVTALAQAAIKFPAARVIGAFLVAPLSEASMAALPRMVPGVVPFSRDPLPFPSLLVASRSDPHCGYDEAGDMALNWGSTLVDAGDVGHLDAASGHGPWPEGAMRFGWFLKQLGNANTV